MPTLTADKVVNHELYAKANVNGYQYPNTSSAVTYTYTNGQDIGNIYSWVTGSDGNVYWMIYANDADYQNQTPTYIKHDSSQITVPDVPDIIAQIDADKKAADIAKEGVVAYYTGKYLPYIVGAIVLVILAPTIINQIKKR